MKNKVLMVAFHFPPQAGSSGILRTLNFAKHMPANNWQPIVLSAHPRAYEKCSNDLLNSIPKGTRVYRAFALDAAKHLGIRRKYPGIFALPDRWASWWIGAVIKGFKIIRDEKPDLIWSTYPISSAHLIGATLAMLSSKPWVADFRDPMVNGNYPKNALQRSVWLWIERLVFKNASRCVFTTERAAQTYRNRYPDYSNKCLVIENGYDEEAFADNKPKRDGVSENKLLILHSGIIYPRDRDPSGFFLAISNLIKTGNINREELVIRFRAPGHPDEVSECARRHGLEDITDIAPSIPYREAIAEMLGADLLLVFQGSQFNAQIPAKIYEYLRSGNPILALIDSAGDTASALRSFDGVLLADISNSEDIQNCFCRWLSIKNSGDFQKMMENNRLEVIKFSREKHTVRLANLFNEIKEKEI